MLERAYQQAYQRVDLLFFADFLPAFLGLSGSALLACGPDGGAMRIGLCW